MTLLPLFAHFHILLIATSVILPFRHDFLNTELLVHNLQTVLQSSKSTECIRILISMFTKKDRMQRGTIANQKSFTPVYKNLNRLMIRNKWLKFLREVWFLCVQRDENGSCISIDKMNVEQTLQISIDKVAVAIYEVVFLKALEGDSCAFRDNLTHNYFKTEDGFAISYEECLPYPKRELSFQSVSLLV